MKIPLLAMGGLEHEAQGRTDDLLEKVLAASERAAERTERADERRHREQMQVYDLLSHSQAYDAARNAVSPVGKGCDCMQISDDETSDTITPMMAEAIRTRGSVKIRRTERIVRVGGWLYSSDTPASGRASRHARPSRDSLRSRSGFRCYSERLHGSRLFTKAPPSART